MGLTKENKTTSSSVRRIANLDVINLGGGKLEK